MCSVGGWCGHAARCPEAVRVLPAESRAQAGGATAALRVPATAGSPRRRCSWPSPADALPAPDNPPPSSARLPGGSSALSIVGGGVHHSIVTKAQLLAHQGGLQVPKLVIANCGAQFQAAGCGLRRGQVSGQVWVGGKAGGKGKGAALPAGA